MTDANETFDTIMQELNMEVISDTEETEEEQESLSFHEEAGADDVPPSLLSYFETSKSRAAVCEKLILEELEDFTASHHTGDMMNSPTELDKDTAKLNEQVIWDAENKGNNTSTDTRLPPAPTETEALFTHNVSVCPNNEDEAGTDEYMESEKQLAFEVRTLEISLNEEERKKNSEYEAEREKRHCEEMKKKEQKRQIERDFQKELKKIMEAEKLHQKELELMEKRAQEKLEQELLLQQELIGNLKRRVEEERRMREEEQKRMEDEADKRKREEEKFKVEAERKRMEEEMRRKKEEERKIEEMKLKKEKERKKEEQEKRRMEREETRKREEERNKMDLEKKKLEDEMRMMKEEEERKNKEEVERIKKEEEGKREEERRIEETKKKMEKEKRKMEEEISMKKEQEFRKKEEEDRKKNMRIEEEGRITKEIEERKKQEEMWKKKEEEEADDRNEVYEEMRKSYKREHGNIDEEIKLAERKKKEEKDMKKREEEARRREKETKKIEEKKEVKEVVRKREGENSKMKEELRPIEDDEKRKQEDEWKTKEEEPRRRQKDEMRRQRDEEDYRKSEEEIRLKEDKEGYKGYDNRKMEHERKTKDKEKKQQEEEEEKKQGKEKMRTREEERKNVKAEKEQNGEEVRENKKEVNKKTEEEIRGKEKEESKTRSFQDREKEVKVNKLQEKRENNSMMGQNEKKNIDKTDNSLASQLEDGTTWTSSNLGPLHSESTICPTITETTPQQHGLDKNISQTTTMSVFIPVCLPEHTEQKRLSWMKDCIPWSKLALQNRRKQKGSVQSLRGRGRVSEASSLPPLCPDSLLQSTGWKSLAEVTTVTLEDLPGCSLSTLTQCTQLRSLTLRRCGLKSLEGINQLPRLYYIDVQENDISFVDCENMTSLRVLQLAHNKLTSIHGLTGAENLDVLDLSHNSITRIAGLESMRRLQRLSVDHNQLISTKGLRDVYTLLYLNCSHNHLASVEGLENSALLNTLDLRANSLTEPPSLKNQVLLRELHLDDNSISSLQDLTACWLPLMQHLSVAQNRITQLPSMSDAVSLANLDLRFNCMSELQNVCESLEGCQFLREVHLAGNPLQQESGWRSTLQRAVPGLRAIDDQGTDSFLSPPAIQQVSLALGSFLTFCQAQLQQTHDLQQQHSRELSDASSSLDAAKTSYRHFTEALQLAEDQRFAHEYGDTIVADKHGAAGQTTPEETLDMDTASAVKRTERPETESTGKVPPVIPNRDNIRCSSWTFEEKSVAESRHDTFDTVATGPKTGPKVNKTNSGSVTIPSNLEMAPVSNHQSLDLQNTAAVVIQQLWRKYRQKCGNISSPSTAEKGGGRGGDGGKPESGPSYINGSQDYAATVIQAFWRGFTLRRRLASALAAVTCLDTGEDDTFEEVDVDEFVFDEAALEKHWTLLLSEDSPPRRYSVSEQPLSLKPPGPFSEPSQYILPPQLVWRSKQAWMAGEQVDSAGQRVSTVSSNRSKSPASNSVVTGLSERSEKILEEWGFTHSHTALLMLKRAQNMKSKKQQQKKRRDPAVRLALFRNCSYQLGPLEARNRQAQNNRNDIKVREAEPGLQQAEKTERVKQERAQQWLHTQAAHSDRDSESAHFLPEISSDILNGGRVQLVADPGYTERLHHASGLWANSSLAAQPRKENNYPRRNSMGHARKEVPSPKRATSAPSKKERISFRDNPVQLSGGWGGGKKRDKVYK